MSQQKSKTSKSSLYTESANLILLFKLIKLLTLYSKILIDFSPKPNAAKFETVFRRRF